MRDWSEERKYLCHINVLNAANFNFKCPIFYPLDSDAICVYMGVWRRKWIERTKKWHSSGFPVAAKLAVVICISWCDQQNVCHLYMTNNHLPKLILHQVLWLSLPNCKVLTENAGNFWIFYGFVVDCKWRFLEVLLIFCVRIWFYQSKYFILSLWWVSLYQNN